MVFASASPTASASRPRIDLSSSRPFTGRRSVLSSRRPFVGASDAHHHHRRVGSRRIDVSVVAAAAASNADDEIAMLTKMLQLAKERKVHETTTTGDDQKTTSKGGYDGTRFDFWDSFRLESAFLRRRKKEIFRLSRGGSREKGQNSNHKKRWAPIDDIIIMFLGRRRRFLLRF